MTEKLDCLLGINKFKYNMSTQQLAKAAMDKQFVNSWNQKIVCLLQIQLVLIELLRTFRHELETCFQRKVHRPII